MATLQYVKKHHKYNYLKLPVNFLNTFAHYITCITAHDWSKQSMRPSHLLKIYQSLHMRNSTKNLFQLLMLLILVITL